MIHSVPVSTVDAVPWRVALTSGNGNRNLDVTIATFPVGSLLNFTFLGNAEAGRKIVYTATIARPADPTLEHTVLSDQCTADFNVHEPLHDGFAAAAGNGLEQRL